MTNTLFFLSVLSPFQNPEPKRRQHWSCVFHSDIPTMPKRQQQSRDLLQNLSGNLWFLLLLSKARSWELLTYSLHRG